MTLPLSDSKSHFQQHYLYIRLVVCYVRRNTRLDTRLTALFPGLPGWAGTIKVKPIWILLKQQTMSGSVISWAICKSASRFRQITMPAPHHSVFYRPDALLAAQPTASEHWRQYKPSYIRRKQTVIHLPTPPENVTTLTCELQNFFIWLKVCCVLSNVGGFQESQLWVVVGGSENNQLWSVTTGMSGKHCHRSVQSDHLLR